MKSSNNIQLFVARTALLVLLSSSSSSWPGAAAGRILDRYHDDASSAGPSTPLFHAQPIMDPSTFHSILFTDLHEELHKLNSTAIYFDSTSNFWEQDEEEEETVQEQEPPTKGQGEVIENRADCMKTFIACNTLPNMSGYARKNDLMNKLTVVHHSDPITIVGTRTTKVRLVARILLGDAIYNGQDQTCFFVSMSLQRAKGLLPSPTAASSSSAAGLQLQQQVKEEEKNTTTDVIVLQPMLPMMKIGLGTVKRAIELTVTMMSSTSSTRTVSILAQLSPFAKNDKAANDDNRYMDVIRHIQNRSKEVCQEELLRALPYTGTIYSCPTLLQALPMQVDVFEQQEDHDVVRFTMDVGDISSNSSTTTVTQGVLAIVTGLASSSYFTFLEIEEEQEYYYYFT
jgi:hypothetical protein